jgi:general secretion pathway protein G
MNGDPHREDGYTITEVLIVLAVLGLLAGSALPMMSGAVQKAREATLSTNLSTIRTVIDEYYADHLSYPDNLNVLVDEDYLRLLPMDTIEREPEEWDLVYEDGGNGIKDIKSRSTSEARNGSSYAQW